VISAQSDGEFSANRLIGMTVYNAQGDKIGTVHDILLDQDGKATGAEAEQLQQLMKDQTWNALSRALGVKVIHVSERDHQTSQVRKCNGEFVNTWSSEAFCGESLQPAELGWGTHERNWPADGREYGFGCGAAIYLDRPGVATRVRSCRDVSAAARAACAASRACSAACTRCSPSGARARRPASSSSSRASSSFHEAISRSASVSSTARRRFITSV